MEVTRENFNAILPDFLNRLQTASFVSFDEEMTGITMNDYHNRRDDDPESRYQKMQKIASRFAIIQLGLCLFHQSDNGDITATPYCFYIFPDSGDDVILSSSAINFLRTNNMDFGKWISLGIPYVDKEGETRLRKKYFPEDVVEIAPSTAVSPTDVVLTKQADQEYFNRNIAGFKSMMHSEEQKEFVFEKANAFLRRAIYQHLEAHYNGQVLVSTNSEYRIVAVKCTEEEFAASLVLAAEEKIKKFNASLGFRRVFNALVECRKPLIGHNCTFDLLFLFRALHGPLPPTFDEFRRLVVDKFPVVCDTKYIFASGLMGPIIDSTLGDLFTTIVDKHRAIQSQAADSAVVMGELEVASRQPSFDAMLLLRVRLAEGFDSYDASAQFHDAGFDAYCTGYLFADCVLHFNGLENAILNCSNRLFMMQSLFRVNLSVDEPIGEFAYKGALYLVADFPEKTGPSDILTIFTDAGVDLGSMELMWIDGRSVFIHIDKSAKLPEGLSSLALPNDWVIKQITKPGDIRKDSVDENESDRKRARASELIV